jgi:hypothetical protein
LRILPCYGPPPPLDSYSDPDAPSPLYYLSR